METVEDALHSLKVKLHGHDWFDNRVARCPQTQNGLIAYVNRMNYDILQAVPDSVGGWNVKVHYTSSLCEDPSKHVTVVTRASTIPAYVPEPTGVIARYDGPKLLKNLAEEPVFTPALDLRNELFNLRRECGPDNLTDIFYEVHDGDDAVTSFSQSFPSVRTKMQELYNEYGFDVLFEELDG